MQMPIALFALSAWVIASIAAALLFGAFVRAGRPAGERDENAPTYGGLPR